MRTSNFLSASLLAMAIFLSACDQKEEEKPDPTPAPTGQNEVAFTLSEVSTKADLAEAEPESFVIATTKVGDSESLILEDRVTDLDGGLFAPETKGTPAFTENVLKLYGSFNAVSKKADGSQAFKTDDVPYVYDGEKYWRHSYGEDINANLPTTYFMRMPATADGVSGLSYDVSDASISFSYTSPSSASSQKDILFTSHVRKEATNGEPIIFYHALTGVKFSNFFNNPTLKTKTYIKSVTVSGLKNSGSCKVTPDITKKSSVVSVWTGQTGSASFTQTFSETFADYSAGSYGLDGLLESGATAQNLNDDNGSLTFWFIPQTLTSDVKIQVLFDVVIDGKTSLADQTLEVSLGESLKEAHREWKAGQLHTFTLKPTAVEIDITDEMTDYEKSNVVITNLGNTREYVRVNIIGNWVGKIAGSSEYTILNGYTSEDKTVETEVKLWNDKDGETNYGTFVDLPAKSTTSSPAVLNNWVRFDKYYYYTKAVGAGDAVPSTDPVFKKYTIGASPDFWIADVFGNRKKAEDVHFEMDIVVQAIAVPVDASGNDVDYMNAWAQALGFGDNVGKLDE